MKREIEIIDGSDESSYFSIMPVRILNFEDTGFSLNVDEMHSVMISIEEEDVFEPHPVKRTMKNYKIFPGWQLRLPAAFYAARYRSCFSIGVRMPRLRCTRRVL